MNISVYAIPGIINTPLSGRVNNLIVQICNYFNIKKSELTKVDRSRADRLPYIKKFLVYFIWKRTRLSDSRIAKYLGIDRSTVCYHRKTFINMLKPDADLQTSYRNVYEDYLQIYNILEKNKNTVGTYMSE